MNRKILFIILCSLAAGTGVGYVVGSREEKKSSKAPTLSESITQSRAPRFGEIRKNLTDTSIAESTAVFKNKGGLDSLLQKYSRMTPEQIEAEMKELCQGDLINGQDLDMKRILGAVYLSYKWGQTSPKQALLQTKSMGMMSMLATPLIMQGWAESNPESAATYYSENKGNMVQGKFALRTIASEMARNSPDSAMQWVETLEAEERRQALPGIMSGIAENHPEQLAANIGKLSAEDMKNNSLCRDIADKWARSNWEETDKWINTLPAEQQANVRESALGSLSAVDLDKATTEFKRLGTEEQAAAARSIVTSLSRKGGAESLDWLVKNASENDALRNVPSAVGYSAMTGDNSMRDYITSMPTGTLKDTALQDYMSKCAMNPFDVSMDYESNIALASNIGDEKKREAATLSALESWTHKQPEKAKAWINQSSSLSPERKEQYLKKCDTASKRVNK